jgi:signal transduction histidine kinase
MKSFTKKIVLYSTGVIFISFLIVYFLFNVLVGNYIRAQAERELAGGMQDVVGLTYVVSSAWMLDADDVNRTMPDGAPSVWLDRTIQSDWFEIEFRYQPELSDILDIEFRTQQENESFARLFPAGADAGIVAGGRFFPTQDGQLVLEDLPPIGVGTEITWGEWGEVVFHDLRPIRSPSFINADVIIVNEYNDVIVPRLETLSEVKRAEVEFLINYYSENRSGFVNHEMRRVSGANITYYVSTVTRPIENAALSILMYTDISAAMVFTNTMNRILGFLLVISGIFSLAISIAMSARFKKAIVGLCNYAETIGRGNFNEKVEVYKDTEFNQLSKSMNNMSNMLQTYENKQKQFFQNVSHELRTPLMSIQGYAEGIQKDIFTKEEAADIILCEGQKMTELVDELLYISRIDSAIETPKNISPVNVKDLLFECCERVKPIAQNCGKQITIASLDEEILINANAEKLERAIINILSNAIRYANSEVKIKYETKGETLRINIEDDGSGIAPEDLPNIFERFYKGENGNYGLGLAISKDIVKSFGGNILAENKTAPETGAVFTVVL